MTAYAVKRAMKAALRRMLLSAVEAAVEVGGLSCEEVREVIGGLLVDSYCCKKKGKR